MTDEATRLRAAIATCRDPVSLNNGSDFWTVDAIALRTVLFAAEIHVTGPHKQEVPA